MIGAIGALGAHENPEHKKIIQELLALGISPSGVFQIDKSKLEQAKKNQQLDFVLNIETDEQNYYIPEYNELYVGATQLGKLNRLFLGL